METKNCFNPKNILVSVISSVFIFAVLCFIFFMPSGILPSYGLCVLSAVGPDGIETCESVASLFSTQGVHIALIVMAVVSAIVGFFVIRFEYVKDQS